MTNRLTRRELNLLMNPPIIALLGKPMSNSSVDRARIREIENSDITKAPQNCELSVLIKAIIDWTNYRPQEEYLTRVGYYVKTLGRS
jgi:hypothetical protein